MTFTIRIDDLSGSESQALLAEHLDGMRHTTPAEHVFALDLNELKDPSITFWSVWDQHSVVGIGALKDLGNGAAELKSIRTAANYLRRGVAATLVAHIIDQAKTRRLERLSLETGKGAEFAAAAALPRCVNSST